MVKLNCDNNTSKRRVRFLFVVIGVILTSYAGTTVQADSNYYDQHEPDEPIFRDAPSSEDYAAISLTDDSRFPISEPSWKLKLAPETKPSPRIMMKPKLKRNCGLPSVATRGLIGSTIKRSEIAISRSDLESKVLDEETARRKREIKRSGSEDLNIWRCESTYEWKDMGLDHYPRYVRNARCESRRCANGLFHCHGRTYNIKVLKRVVPSHSPACEEDVEDDSLPDPLRSDWRLITVPITHCCDCSGLGRLPGSS